MKHLRRIVQTKAITLPIVLMLTFSTGFSSVSGFSNVSSISVASFADTAVNNTSKTKAEEIKQLKAELTSATGIKKVDLLNAICDKLTATDPDQAISYADEAITLALELGYKFGEIDGINHLGYISLAQDAPDDALLLFKDASDKSSVENYIKGLAYSSNGFGILWANLGDYAKGLDSFENAAGFFSSLKDNKGIAFVKNNMGTVYDSMGLPDKAIIEYQGALSIYETLGLQEELAVTLNNLGSSNESMGNYDSALSYFRQAFDIHQSLGYKKENAIELNNIGSLYLAQELLDDALAAYQKAMEIAESLSDKGLIAEVLLNLGHLYEKNNDFTSAINNYKKALDRFQSIQDFEGEVSALNNLGGLYAALGEAQKALDFHLKAYEASKTAGYREGLKHSLKQLATDYQALSNYAEASHYLTLYTELVDTLQQEQTAKAFANSEVLYDTEKKSKEILKQKEEIAQRIQERNRLLLIVGIIAVSLILITFLLIWVAKERKKSEKLLLNILPKKVANDLKKTGKTIPERFEGCTVYFSDIANFTTTSEKLDPVFLISELNDIFTTFDAIMEKYGCERIKTIGDAYMAVCGVPVPVEDHAERMVNAAREILIALDDRNARSDLKWRIRIGINSGQIVGGVVGVKKYIYDVFGDTINTASRMESNSEPMRINISKNTYEIVKDNFETTPRSPIEVKGKGLQEMYFIEGPIVYSEGKEPA